MPRPHAYNTEAVILRTASLGEADRLLTLFTPTLGKLTATARGVRKPTSKLGGHLDSLTRSSLTLAKGRTLDTITGADTLEAFIPMRSNLDWLSQAFYLAELVDAMNPPEAPNPHAYAILLEGLTALGRQGDHEVLMRYLELRLLACSGFLPELHYCVECRNTLVPTEHLFSPQAGGAVCPGCRSANPDATHVSVESLKVLRYLATETLEASRRLNVSQPLHNELARIVSAFLRHILGREVRSVAFLRSVRRHQPETISTAPATV